MLSYCFFQYFNFRFSFSFIHYPFLRSAKNVNKLGAQVKPHKKIRINTFVGYFKNIILESFLVIFIFIVLIFVTLISN